MSFNRENVVWQSSDRTWNRGFYAVVWVGEDPEWDVEYGDTFEWVRTGLPSQQAAEDAWDGPNPGGWSVVKYNAANKERCQALSKMARALKKSK